MTPENVKEWANALTAPALLFLLCFGIWRVVIYFREKFMDPLGGADGRFSKFLEETTSAVGEMKYLRESYETMGARQTQLLESLDAKQQEFSTETTNEMLRDLFRAKALITAALEKMHRTLKEKGEAPSITHELHQIQALCDKWAKT